MKKILVFGMSSTVGGVENFILNLYENVNKNKFKIDFLVTESLSGYYYNKIVTDYNAKVYTIPSIKKHFFKSLKLIRKISKNENYDFIHINLCSAQLFLYVWFFKIFSSNNLKIITHSHSSGETNIFRKILHFVFRPLIIKNTDYYIGCSNVASKWMFGKKIASSKKNIIIKNAILLDKYKFNKNNRILFRKKYGYDDKTFVIGHVGRFEDVKNHRFIIDFFNKYYKINKNSRLVLVGAGSLKNEIKDLVSKLKLNKVVVFIDVTNDVNVIYHGIDLFILPSLFEGLPIVSVEAQSSGLKCVVSNNVSSECNLTGDVSFLPLNIDEWITEINNIYKSGFSRINKIQQIIDSGYDLKTEIKKIEKIYGDKDE